MAGLPGRNGSLYGEWERTAEWKKYAEEMQAAWTRAEERRVRPVRAFQSRELTKDQPAASYVFYPFSGPDVIYAQSFYPEGRTYILAGLERPGTVTGPAGYTLETLREQLNGVRRGSASLFDRSFFITNEMSQQLRGQLVDGVLPVALMLMARTGNQILNSRNVIVREDGTLEEISEAQGKRGPRPDGFEITFRREGEKQVRTLSYFRLDLGPALNQDPSFLKFLDSKGTPETLIKSASFLLHYAQFSKLRDYLLDRSVRIVQDDTGVRYGKLVERGWRVRLYGDYSRPDHPFTSKYQQDLDEAFDRPGSAGELGFSVGYGSGRRPSHLIVAERPAAD